MSPDPAPIVSPCRKVCAIDADSGLCLGCLRSLEEIALWSRYSDAQRRAVMAALPDREPGRPAA